MPTRTQSALSAVGTCEECVSPNMPRISNDRMFDIEADESTSSVRRSEDIRVRRAVNVEGETDRWEALTTHIEYSKIEADGVPSRPQMAENFLFDSGTAAAQHVRNSSFVIIGRSGDRVEK